MQLRPCRDATLGNKQTATGLAAVLTALLSQAGCLTVDFESAEEPETFFAERAIAATRAAGAAATVVDLTVGGMSTYTYVGADVEEATRDSFVAVFDALSVPPFDACVVYEQMDFSSLTFEFVDCPATETTPSISGRMYVEIHGAGDPALLYATMHVPEPDLLRVDETDLWLTARCEWNPAAPKIEQRLKQQQLVATAFFDETNAVTVAGNLGLDSDARCQAIDGRLGTEGPEGGLDLIVERYRRCLDTCPEAGGVVRHERAASGDDEAAVEVLTFDGSDVATAETVRGRAELPVDCNGV